MNEDNRDVRGSVAIAVCPICYFTREGVKATMANLREHMREQHESQREAVA